MTRPGIEPWSPWPLANTLPSRPILSTYYMHDVTAKITNNIKQSTKIEMLGVIRFLYPKGQNPTGIHCEQVAVYGNHVIKRKQVSVTYKVFIEECRGV